MDLTSFWYLVALGLIVAEFVTGTYYLLVLSVGLTSAGTVAMLGGNFDEQLITTIFVSLIGVLVLYTCKSVQSQAKPAPLDTQNHQINIGTMITVPCWNQDRTARINYRGTSWKARLARDVSNNYSHPGIFKISDISDATLILVPGR